MAHTQRKTVFVGLSGGVDSSVAALRLKKAGYDVVGVFIKVWHPAFLTCNWEQERLDAMRVAARLHIPFLTCDAQQSYKDDVADYFINQYRQGYTPNPDVMCNKYVKFGAFLEFAKKHNADFVATGHYAQCIAKDSTYTLVRGIDEEKDQSYFLWMLTQEQLSKTLFPIGDSKKVDVRKEAQEAGLITANKKDSQGICFLGFVDIPDFLSHYIDLQDGAVLNEQGSVIGTHRGALVYTINQRHGFTITDPDPSRPALYVTDRNIAENTITVSPHKTIIRTDDTITLTALNFIGWVPQAGATVSVQTRYRQKPTLCTVTRIGNDSLSLAYDEDGEAVSAGQSCVLYDGLTCLGGGIIS